MVWLTGDSEQDCATKNAGLLSVEARNRLPKGAVQGPAASYGDLEFLEACTCGTQRIGAIQIKCFPKRNPQGFKKFVTGGLLAVDPC